MFSLVPEVIPLLCQALVAGIAGVYVIARPRKTRAAWWLVALLFGQTFFAISYLLGMAAGPTEAWSVRFNLGLYAGIAVAVYASVRLSYTFLARPFRREERLAAWGFGAVLAVLLALSGYAAVTFVPAVLEGVLSGVGVFLVVAALWALAVHVRQAARFHRLASGPVRAAARRSGATGHSVMVGLVALMLMLSVVNALSTFGALPIMAIQVTSLVVDLVVVVGLVVAFINHAPEPTTVQAKLVGVALGVVLALLGLTSMALLKPGEIAVAAGNVILAEATVRFAPDAQGGYQISRPEAAPLPAGARLEVVPETPSGEGGTLWTHGTIALPFAFPIDGQAYRSATLARVPYVAFGASGACEETCLGLVTEPDPGHPVALAFVHHADFKSEDWPVVTASADRLDAVWTLTGFDGQDAEHRVTLWADGRVEIAYRGPERRPRVGSAGLHLGSGDRLAASFADALPPSVPPGAALVDAYGARFTAIAHERTARMVPLVLGATVVVLVLFPLFLRRGVLGPLADLLAGVERVHRGERDLRLVARANDEFGVLTRRFNTMAGSLGTAEARLREYAGHLEERVAERTRELEAANADLGEKRDALAASLAELQAAQSQLVQAEKQASLGRLTSGIAHEIKNPLNFVNNFAGLSRDAVDDLRAALAAGDAEEAEAILGDLALNAEKIETHGLRADRIVQGMMLHARGAGERSPTDLNDLLRLAAEGVARATTDRTGGDGLPPIALDLDPDVGEVDVAPEGVLQVAASLLDNALYATTHAASADAVRLSSRRQADAVEVSVADHGTGIPEADRARVFEPFFTTKPPGEGTGLGLSLAYDIVTAGHGGEIAFESRLGEGTTFTVRLPAEA